MTSPLSFVAASPGDTRGAGLTPSGSVPRTSSAFSFMAAFFGLALITLDKSFAQALSPCA
jgi:hypothetical protein